MIGKGVAWGAGARGASESFESGEAVCFEPLEDVAYLYDGTLEGLLSAVFLAYERHEDPLDVVPQNCYEPRLGQSSLLVDTDMAHATRVRRGVERACGKAAFTAILRAQACDGRDTGGVIYRFIRYVMARPERLRKHPVLEELTQPEVAALVRLEKHAINESERVRQFARFSHLENGVWFARICPNASVVPLVMGYFVGRFNDQPFLIYDEGHAMSGLYNGHSWQLVRGEVSHVPNATSHDKHMEEAWKRFYDALSIDARYNPELRRQFMPVRLWNNLPEMHPRSQ